MSWGSNWWPLTHVDHMATALTKGLESPTNKSKEPKVLTCV